MCDTKTDSNTGAAVASDTAKVILLPYHEDRTFEEGSRHKIHISETGNNALCGFSHHCFVSLLIGLLIIDVEWLDQPDPDDQICKKCAKIARKVLAI